MVSLNVNSVSPFPLKSIKGSGIINNVYTDVVITEFSNMLFIVVTQEQKIGTLMSVKKEPVHGDILPVYHISTLLGKDEPELHVAARYLDEKLNTSKPLLISLCLKTLPDYSTVVTITELLNSLWKNKELE